MSLSGYENVVKLDNKNPQHNQMYKEIELSFAYQVLLLMKKYNCRWSDIKSIKHKYYHNFVDDKQLHTFTVKSTLIVNDLELKPRVNIWQRIKRWF